MVPEMLEDQYKISGRMAIYLPELDCLLLHAAWITNKELRNTILYPEMLVVGITGGTNIEDHMLMIVAGLENIMRKFPSTRAFLPSECQWVFNFSFSYIFPKPLGIVTTSHTTQVTQINTQWAHIISHHFEYYCVS
jgi:hypothetical protein